MSLTVAEALVVITDDHEGCLLCTTSRTPAKAYRPHTLDPRCWCTRNGEGQAVLSECYLIKAYLPDRFWQPDHP